MTLSQLASWAIAHPEALAALVVAARVLYALASRIAAPYPRARAVVEGIAALGPDVLRAVQQLGSALLGRPLPSLDARAPDDDRAQLRARIAELEAMLPAPPSPSKVPAGPVDHSGERGTVRLGAVALLLAAALCVAGLGAVLTGCPGPTPPVDGGPAVTPSGWTSTARVVLSTLRWAVPAARAITDGVLPEPARTQVGRALDATGDAAQELGAAVDAYEARGGDQCAAHAAVGGLHRALVGLARVLADGGLALGTTLERVADGVASVADALVPACDRDAGWSSAGDSVNRELRSIAEGAAARGVVLRRDLDDLRPVDGGVR